MGEKVLSSRSLLLAFLGFDKDGFLILSSASGKVKHFHGQGAEKT
jgi:hypothetical protein